MYLWCYLRSRNDQLPCAPHVGLKLFLPLLHPRRIMLLSYLDAAVTEYHRNAVHRYPGLEQVDGERVSEAVGAAVWNPRRLGLRQTRLVLYQNSFPVHLLTNAEFHAL